MLSIWIICAFSGVGVVVAIVLIATSVWLYLRKAEDWAFSIGFLSFIIFGISVIGITEAVKRADHLTGYQEQKKE